MLLGFLSLFLGLSWVKSSFLTNLPSGYHMGNWRQRNGSACQGCAPSNSCRFKVGCSLPQYGQAMSVYSFQNQNGSFTVREVEHPVQIKWSVSVHQATCSKNREVPHVLHTNILSSSQACHEHLPDVFPDTASRTG